MAEVITFSEKELRDECKFLTSRSSGAGGQNVNKVNTKVELRFHIENSTILGPEEKALLHIKLASRINQEGYLIIQAQTSRSQLKNREDAFNKLVAMIRKALMPVKKRKKTKPTAASRQKRMETKRIHSSKKETRRKIEP